MHVHRMRLLYTLLRWNIYDFFHFSEKKEFEFIIILKKVLYEPVVYYSVCTQRKRCAYKPLKR